MEQRIDRILRAAVRAPSGDNTQPWRLLLSGEGRTIDLYNVPERDPSYFNYRQLAAHVAHGALVENLLLAAGEEGYAAGLELFPSPGDRLHIARIGLVASDVTPDPLCRAIFQRQTERRRFRSMPLAQKQMEHLRNAAAEVDGVRFDLLGQGERMRRMAWTLRLNDRLAFEHRMIHQFLFRQIRWNAEETARSGDGMPLETLGLNPMDRLLFPLFRSWRRVDLLNRLGLSRFIGLRGWINCRSAGALGVISVPERTPQAFLAAGRALQRIWLQATLDGLAFQPVTGLFFLLHRADAAALDGFSAAQRAAIGRAGRELRQLCGYGDRVPVMAFRIGVPDGPPQPPLTPRMAPL